MQVGIIWPLMILALGCQPLWEYQPAPIRLLLFFSEHFCSCSLGENSVTFFTDSSSTNTLIPVPHLTYIVDSCSLWGVLLWRNVPTFSAAFFGAFSKQYISAVVHPVHLLLSFRKFIRNIYLLISLPTSLSTLKNVFLFLLLLESPLRLGG